MIEKEIIYSFYGRNRFLSNFSLHPLRWADTLWPTAEHAYQAAKTVWPDDAWAIWRAATPALAKKMGRRLETVRSDWAEAKYSVMRAVITAKFDPVAHPERVRMLVGTGSAVLVEGNHWHDQVWGDCRCGRRSECGVAGDNALGKILMDVRESLRS